MLENWKRLGYYVVLITVADYAKARKRMDQVQKWPDGPGKKMSLVFLQSEIDNYERFLKSQYCACICPDMEDGGETVVRYLRNNYKTIRRGFMYHTNFEKKRKYRPKKAGQAGTFS